MDKCVVRQAIKETETRKIVGYELLFQGGSDDFFDNHDNSAADTIASFLMQNSEKIFSDKPTFITFTPSLLFRNTPKIFEKEKLVIQIEDNLIVHPLALPIIRKYKNDGYRFAINDFQFTPKYFGMLEHVDYIRINLEGKGDAGEKAKSSLDNIVRMAQGFGKRCIATGVNAKEEYELAVNLGVEFMEGNYIAETLVTKANKIEYMQGNFFQLVVSVSKDEPDLEEVENIIKRDAGLTYALLKMVNSAYFALRRRTASIRQALVTLGIGQLREWVYMLSFNNDENSGSEELLKLSFLRASFSSELSTRIRDLPISKSEAYMMGIFSGLEYMIDASMEEILGEIPVRDEVKDALIKGEGKAGKLYRLVLAYEKADWTTSNKMAGELELSTGI